MPESHRRAGVAGLVAAALLSLLAGCSAAPAAGEGPSGSTTATGATSASATVPLGDVPKDPGATLDVGPVAFDDQAVVVATFATAVPGRPVSLQKQTDGGWQEVGQASQDKKGRAEFHPGTEKATYRAVALDYDSDLTHYAAATTPRGSASGQWKQVFGDEFDGSSLRKPLAVRSEGQYFAPRYCAASMSSMVSVGDGVLGLGVDKVGGTRATRVRANAARANGTSLAKACADGVYDNAMVGTQDRFLFTYGVVAARVKFPVQRGMHSAVWLQTPDGKDIEIDIIESFGFRSSGGIQNMLHPKSSTGERLDVGQYVTNVPEIKTQEWWNEYHVVSIEWSPSGYVFRIDGVETFRTTKAKSSRPHFLVLSLQTSDYETNRLDRSQLPASFDVDWVRIWQER
ncbi:family 16 glycosylhydrolase [Propionicimonas sp.]|uniref:glycoside hydrolase family 16 protein n=1 Tax=Propionicimonas sp. TaxID=1955623 RepID=UPI0039E59EFB